MIKMTQMCARCPSTRRGWKVYKFYTGRKLMTKDLRKLRFEGYIVMPVKLGGISCKLPYAIAIRQNGD